VRHRPEQGAAARPDGRLRRQPHQHSRYAFACPTASAPRGRASLATQTLVAKSPQHARGRRRRTSRGVPGPGLAIIGVGRQRRSPSSTRERGNLHGGR
jgi:hypothetical protein